MTLTDTQLVLLSTASQREDGLLTPPAHLKGGAAQKVVAKLLAHGLVEEVSVTSDQPCWRQADDGAPIGLKFTRNGLLAIGIEPADSQAPAAAPETFPAQEVIEPAQAEAAEQEKGRSPGPRPGTKQALILSLLNRERGATLDELVVATGWLPHTARAALTGLRQKGHAITRTKREDGCSAYWITAGEVARPSSVPATDVGEAA
jgi:hypothetical protein